MGVRLLHIFLSAEYCARQFFMRFASYLTVSNITKSFSLDRRLTAKMQHRTPSDSVLDLSYMK